MPKEFPHLLKPDVVLWRRFLQSRHNRYSTFLYDVRVGVGTDPGEDTPDNIRRMAIDLSKRRIDAIGLEPSLHTIIEISLQPGLTQIGQLTTYPTLYRTTYNYTGALSTLLVAETIHPDIKTALDSLRLPFVTV